MIKVVNLARVATSILMILVLLFVYANLPDTVRLLDKGQVFGGLTLDKNAFFYTILLTSLIINLVIGIFGRLLKLIPVNSNQFFFSSDRFKENFVAWMVGFAPVLNLFFVFIVAFIGIYNNGDQVLIESYSYLAYIGQFLVIAWVLILGFILLKKNAN